MDIRKVQTDDKDIYSGGKQVPVTGTELQACGNEGPRVWNWSKEIHLLYMG